ncbi:MULTISPECIES: acyltransferase [unclassified Chryseobacterium]|uniref:acyltransferase family protein n=1 Tax=unclassified Chryseobacterium TaxID=2593645 RepID=UPI00226A84A6|nr:MULTISPECIES: acyltransferase [unclassified Chryseobacterium]
MEKRIFGFDIIRSLAILLVMTGHVLGYIYEGEYSFFISFFSGLFGVELFFVLSGVLIGKLLIEVFETNNIRQNVKNFIIRRWLRTLPLYFIMLFVYWFGNKYFDSVKNADVALWKYFLFIQNFFHEQPTFFGVSWSLSIEEWFYILFPFTLFLIKKIKQNLSTKRIFAVGVFIFLLGFLLMRMIAFSHYNFNFYEGVRKVAFLRLDAIAVGILMSVPFYFYEKKVLLSRCILLGLGIVLIMINQYIIIRNHYSNLYYFNTFYYSVLGLGLAFVFPVFKEIKCSNRLFLNIFTFISKISYSLYLQHWLVFKLLELNSFSFIPGTVKFILFFLLSFITATISYVCIEKPIMNYRNRVYGKHK